MITLVDFLRVATQVTMVVIAILTLRNYLRYRSQAQLDIALLFGALAYMVLMQSVTAVVGTLPPLVERTAAMVRMAHPYLLLRLVSHFRPVPRRMTTFAIAGLLVSVILLAIFPDDMPVIVTEGVVAYFAIVAGYAAVAFIRGAQTTRGVTHFRLLLVAYGSALLAAAILVAGITAAFEQEIPWLSTVPVAFGLLSMLSYYAGFAPPFWLRRAWQLSELNKFLQQTVVTDVSRLGHETLHQLCVAAVRTVGGLSAYALMPDPVTQDLVLVASAGGLAGPGGHKPGPALYHAWRADQPMLITIPRDFPESDAPLATELEAKAILSVPIRGHEGSLGVLALMARRPPLFVGDDLRLMLLLSEQAAILLGYSNLLGRQQQLLETLNDRTRQLEIAYRELEAFSYSVSHDLRAPLRHVVGYVELLQRSAGKSLDERSHRYLQVILQSANRMGHLIDDLLTFSRYGRSELAPARVNMRQLVTEVISELQPETSGRRVQWKIDALPDMAGDRSMLRQVWINLISNALKFTRLRSPASIEVSYNISDSEVIFYVKDNGIGFNMQYADKLFGVFQRLHSADDYEGTGIGLANVHRIIMRHGGRTWAEGSPDQGAAFFFSLPTIRGERTSESTRPVIADRG